jgi:membrane protease YdiL (CAAX protease family)
MNTTLMISIRVFYFILQHHNQPNMLGLLVIILVSWGLLHFIEKKHIDVLGIVPSANRITQFFLGLILIASIVLLNIYIETIIQKIEWKANEVNYAILWNAFVYHLKSALTEDLIFRGAILYILIQRIGATKAILLSAIVFGVYHWFSYGILHERWIFLVYVFLITGLNGYVWAYTFHKTKSILLPLAFHLGSNFTMSCFFESQPYGELLFSIASKTELTDWSGFLYSFFKGLFPGIATLLCVKLLLKTHFLNPTVK